MTDRWRTYVKGGVETAGGPLPFALTQWQFLLPIFAAIRRALPAGGRLLDVGCGAAIYTALLAHHGYEVVGVDDDLDIANYAAEMIDYFRSSARVEVASAFDLSRYHGRFDLVYSLGVVEHFEQDVTVQLIREQARCGRFVLVAVPTRYMKYAGTVTDERLYRRSQVSALMRQAGLRVRESFVYGEVPSRLAVNLSRWLPRAAYRAIQHFCTYGMGICCVGESLPQRQHRSSA